MESTWILAVALAALFSGVLTPAAAQTASPADYAQLAYLKASNTDSVDWFGGKVAVSANSATESTVVLSSELEGSCATGVDGNQTSNGCTRAGSAYVFTCTSTSGSCTQLAYLKASNTDRFAQFGSDVAVSANSATESTVVVGALGEGSCATGVDGNQTSNGCARAGSAYVFTCSLSIGTCTQLAYLKASNTETGDIFGGSVAVSANSATESTVVVGAPGESSCATGVNSNQTNNACPSAGSGYVFICSSSNGACTQLAYLKASNTEQTPSFGDSFGVSVAVSANTASRSTVVVGAVAEGSCATGVNGNEISNGCPSSGSAYVFACSSTIGSCIQLAYLKPSNTRAGFVFGISVAVSANFANESTVVVGAVAENSCATGVNGNQSDTPSCPGSGSAYVFTCSLATFSCMQLAYLKASNNAGPGGEFGFPVVVSANSATESTIVAGAPGESSCATGVNGNQTNNACSGAGSAYVFICSSSNGTCKQLAYLKASNTAADDLFGDSLAVTTNSNLTTIVVGALREASCATGVDGNQTDNACSQAGSAYVFTSPPSTGTPGVNPTTASTGNPMVATAAMTTATTASPSTGIATAGSAAPSTTSETVVSSATGAPSLSAASVAGASVTTLVVLSR